MKGKHILFGISGSFCNHANILKELEKLCANNDVQVVVSENVYTCSTRFFKNTDFLKTLEELTGKPIMHTIVEAETVGPSNMYDLMIIAPMSASLCSRLKNGLYDHPVALAAKAMVRNQKNIVVGIASNDVLGASAANFFSLIDRKYFFGLPFYQDAPFDKPYSIVSCWSLLEKTCDMALANEQIQPLFYGEEYHV